MDKEERCEYCGSTKLRVFDEAGKERIGWCQECWKVTKLGMSEKPKQPEPALW